MSLKTDIDGQISTVKSMLDDLTTKIDSSIQTFTGIVNDINPNFRLSYATVNPPAEVAPAEPEGKPGDWSGEIGSVRELLTNSLAFPTLPALDTVPSVGEVIFDAIEDAPELSLPSRPGGFDTTIPTKPSFSTPSIPNAPDYDFPTAPSLSSIVIPDTPDFMEIPTFDGVKPSDLDAPAIPVFVFNEGEYASTLKDAAETWLTNIIENGGTGLGADVEQAMIDRAVFREATAFRENLESASDEFSASGFPRPTGALRARLDRLRADFNNRYEDVNRKIFEEQARIAVETSRFAISEAIKHEATMLQHYNAIQDRTLKYAQSIVDVSISTYNLKVTEYQARVEGYKAEASVFESLLRATIIEVERYKAEIEAAMAQVEVDKALVERYQVEVSAVRLLAEFYATQMQAAKIEADIEALNLQAFGAEVDAFNATVAAKRAEYDAYQSSIQGETAKIEAYRSKVDAYRAKAEVKRVQLDAEKTQISAVNTRNLAKLEALKAETDLYRTSIEENSTAIRSAVSAYIAKSDVYRAEIQRASSQNELNIRNSEVALKAAEFNQSQLNETFRLQGQLLVKQVEAAIEGSSQHTKALADFGASVASQINTISQISSAETTSA